MRSRFTIWAVSCWLLAIGLTGCGVSKRAQNTDRSADRTQIPTWHTCLIQGAKATVQMGSDKVNATVTMQTVRDSMIIIHVMPMLGIEMARLEATPEELIAIDKVHNVYATATYKELNKKLTPKITWKQLQQLASAELPTGDEKAHLQYVFDDKTIDLTIYYTPRKTDVPVKMNGLRLNKYTKIDISKWL